MSIAALILGIVSVILGIASDGTFAIIIGLACGIVGIVLATKGLRDGTRHGLSVAALVVSIVGVALIVVVRLGIDGCGGCLGSCISSSLF